MITERNSDLIKSLKEQWAKIVKKRCFHKSQDVVIDGEKLTGSRVVQLQSHEEINELIEYTKK